MDDSRILRKIIVIKCYADGEPETVIDYMDRKLANTKNNPNFTRAIQQFMDYFKRILNCKTLKELDNTQLNFLRLAQ